MKQATNILVRLGKVVYIFLILLALGIGLYVFNLHRPQTTYDVSTIVHCKNGKSFDPASKPISPNDGYPYIPEADRREREISSECQFGTAYFIGSVVNLDMKNHTEETVYTPRNIGSWSQAIGFFLRDFFVIFIPLEIVRRTLRYIFFGKNFFT